MNPTEDRDSVLARYMEGPALLERALAGLSDADLDAPPPQGGWTIRQIVHHVVDGDDLWKVGIKAALGDTPGEFTFAWYWVQAQDVWAERWAYARRSVDVSLDLLKATRAHVRQLLEAVPDGWSRSVSFRKSDGQTVRLSAGEVIKMQTDHVTHHIERIAAIRGAHGGA